MKAKKSMVAWTPADARTETAGKMAVGPWPDITGWSNGFYYTDLACWHSVESLKPIGLEHLCLLIALTAIVRDGLDAGMVDETMAKIDEYVKAINNHPSKMIGFVR